MKMLGNTFTSLFSGAIRSHFLYIEHWHGASPESGMTHVAITNFKGDSQVNWLKPATDEEYTADAQ